MKSCCLSWKLKIVIHQFQRWGPNMATFQLILSYCYMMIMEWNSRTSNHHYKFPPLPYGPNIGLPRSSRQEFLTIWIIIHLLRLPRAGRGVLGRGPGSPRLPADTRAQHPSNMGPIDTATSRWHVAFCSCFCASPRGRSNHGVGTWSLVVPE